MCGFVGSLDLEFGDETLNLIRHRGPDDGGIEKIECAGRMVRFGHRRLSIVDLSPAGHQPMHSDCGRYHLIFNGEIYNHQEIRAGLRQRSFRGHSDTETILYALAEQGIGAVRRFNGIFALAFLDTVKNELFLARDPFGVKPLYYGETGGGLFFSSELKPLLHFTPPELDPEALATLLRLRYVPSPHTLFKRIRKVVPGTFLCCSLASGGIRQEIYAEPVPQMQTLSLKEQQEAYAEKMEAAVQRQLMSDVEVGVLLSGGVDSAVVARLATRHSAGKLKAFTVGFAGTHSEDEIADAAETARLLGMDHHFVKISDQDFFAEIARCVEMIEEPLATTSIIPMNRLAALAASHVKVVLTGQGADEPLGGYGRYQGELVYAALPHLVRRMIGALPGERIRSARIQRGLKMIAQQDAAERFITASEVFSPVEIEGLTGRREHLAHECYSHMLSQLDASRLEHGAAQMMALDTRMNLADDLLNYTDKITMNYSLECRVPLLDLELVKLIESLPVSSRARWKQGKWIHKQYAAGILPSEIVYRPKKGFQSPTREWFRNAGLLREIFADSGSPFATAIAPEAVQAVIARHCGGFNCERHIFLLLTLKYWMDRFLKPVVQGH